MSEIFSVFLKSGRKYIEEFHGYGLKKKHEDNIIKAFHETGELVIENLKRVVGTGNRTGRTYTYNGIKYQASAPGEPPAVRSGKLLRSFGYKAATTRLEIYNEAESDDGAPYPYFLEEGTYKMKPRPYFKKTIESKAEDLRNKLYQVAKEA